jgi:hypothetical protein
LGLSCQAVCGQTVFSGSLQLFSPACASIFVSCEVLAIACRGISFGFVYCLGGTGGLSNRARGCEGFPSSEFSFVRFLFLFEVRSHEGCSFTRLCSYSRPCTFTLWSLTLRCIFWREDRKNASEGSAHVGCGCRLQRGRCVALVPPEPLRKNQAHRSSRARCDILTLAFDGIGRGSTVFLGRKRVDTLTNTDKTSPGSPRRTRLSRAKSSHSKACFLQQRNRLRQTRRRTSRPSTWARISRATLRSTSTRSSTRRASARCWTGMPLTRPTCSGPIRMPAALKMTGMVEGQGKGRDGCLESSASSDCLSCWVASPLPTDLSSPPRADSGQLETHMAGACSA